MNSYPTVRGFTAIGTGGEDFVQAMIVAVESVLQMPIPEVSIYILVLTCCFGINSLAEYVSDLSPSNYFLISDATCFICFTLVAHILVNPFRVPNPK